MAAVGIDLGGTKVMAVRVAGGQITDRAKSSTPRDGGPQAVLDTIAATVRKVDPGGEVTEIGIGVPGPVVPGTGVLPYAANLSEWTHDIDVAHELSGRLGGLTVHVDNDVNVATLAEHRLGAGQGVDNLLGVFMGTGVGGGLVLDGRLRRGPHGLAGEIGHTYVDLDDFHHDRTPRGELEDYAGRRAMEARARQAHGAGRETALVEIAGKKRMKSSVWSKALESGDELARALVDDAAEAMATAFASAVALVDIELIVLGGGMAQRLGDPFRSDIERRLDVRVFAAQHVPIRPAKLGDTGGALGAALLVEEASS